MRHGETTEDPWCYENRWKWNHACAKRLDGLLGGLPKIQRQERSKNSSRWRRVMRVLFPLQQMLPGTQAKISPSMVWHVYSDELTVKTPAKLSAAQAKWISGHRRLEHVGHNSMAVFFQRRQWYINSQMPFSKAWQVNIAGSKGELPNPTFKLWLGNQEGRHFHRFFSSDL